MNYHRVLQYLDAVAANANNDIAGSPHRAFWKNPANPDGNMTYAEFVGGVVPVVHCHGNPVPIIDRSNLPTSASKSAFYLILRSPAGWCDTPAQMPDGGPFITDPGYQVTLDDGTVVTGATIDADLGQWLANGFPED